MKQNHSNAPETIGRFQVQGVLGQGAMAVVYKAFDPEINRTIAIKVLRGDVASDPEYRFRFLTEAKAAGNLVHPNIVTIFDVGETNETPYIAMEYLEGKTLEEEMETGNRFSTQEVLRIGIQLAEALSYSHERKVVHRDIKPSNIMLSPDRSRVRITDFGIAHIENPDKDEHTMLGTVIGTPQYMSPEQVEGLPVDGRSDLFSVGVILYQLLTGEKPFTAGSLSSLFMKIVHEDAPPLRDRAPNITQSLERLIERLLSKEPDKRIANGTELVKDLRDVIREMEIMEQRKAEAHLTPLRVKWTVILALLVSVSMAVSAFFVYRKEVTTMSMLAMDFGGSLVEFVSAQSAEPVLLADWIAIESFVDKTRHRQEITYLQIVDHKGIVRGSSIDDQIGKPFQPLAGAEEIKTTGEIKINEVPWGKSTTFDFTTPIVFKKREVGRVHLGLSKESLNTAAKLTLYTMIGLMLAVVLTVAIVAYFLASSLTEPMKLLRQALRQISEGAMAHRISEKRNDELGQIFNEFNKMAEVLEQTHNGGLYGGEDITTGFENPKGAPVSTTTGRAAAGVAAVGIASATAAKPLIDEDDAPTEITNFTASRGGVERKPAEVDEFAATGEHPTSAPEADKTGQKDTRESESTLGEAAVETTPTETEEPHVSTMEISGIEKFENRESYTAVEEVVPEPESSAEPETRTLAEQLEALESSPMEITGIHDDEEAKAESLPDTPTEQPVDETGGFHWEMPTTAFSASAVEALTEEKTFVPSAFVDDEAASAAPADPQEGLPEAVHEDKEDQPEEAIADAKPGDEEQTPPSLDAETPSIPTVPLSETTEAVKPESDDTTSADAMGEPVEPKPEVKADADNLSDLRVEEQAATKAGEHTTDGTLPESLDTPAAPDAIADIDLGETETSDNIPETIDIPLSKDVAETPAVDQPDIESTPKQIADTDTLDNSAIPLEERPDETPLADLTAETPETTPSDEQPDRLDEISLSDWPAETPAKPEPAAEAKGEDISLEDTPPTKPDASADIEEGAELTVGTTFPAMGDEDKDQEEPEWEMPNFIPSGWDDAEADKTQFLKFDEKEEDVDVDKTQFMSFRPSSQADVTPPPAPSDEEKEEDMGATRFFKPASPTTPDEDDEDDATRFMGSPGSGKKPDES